MGRRPDCRAGTTARILTADSGTNRFLRHLSRPVWARTPRREAQKRGERRMKVAVHSAVHHSVHLCGERKLLGTLMLHMTRRWILGTRKTQNWAGATPLRCHGNRGGIPSPAIKESRWSPGVLPLSRYDTHKNAKERT